MLLLIFALQVSASGIEEADIYFDGGATENETDRIKLIKAPQVDGYCLFLPSTVSSDELTVYFDGSFSVDGAALTSGEATAVFANKETVSAVINGTATTISIFQSTLPSIFVVTQSGSFSQIDAHKEHKEKGTITVADSETVYYDGALKQIKGRGNATWNFPKKPYNFKLDSGAALLGMEKAKNWCLIANHVDTTFMRNQVASELAYLLGMDFAPDGKPVVLYRNGEYAGIYVLTEKVEIDNNRINITSLEKLTKQANGVDDLSVYPEAGGVSTQAPGTYKYCDIPENPEDITGGYLLEIDFPDRYAAEISGFVTKRGFAIVIKEPELASKQQVEYIRDYYQNFEDALFSQNGCNSAGKHYSEYIDVSTFAAMFIVQDLTVNIDSGASSYYMYKEAGEALKAGSVWDFDHSLGNVSSNAVSERNGYNLADPTTTYVRDGTQYCIINPTPVCDDILNSMYDHSDFEQAVNTLWTESYLTQKSSLPGFVDERAAEIIGNVKANSSLHGVYPQTADAEASYVDDCNTMKRFIEFRSAHLTSYYAQDHSGTPFWKDPSAPDTPTEPEEPENPTENPTENPSENPTENPPSKPTFIDQIRAFFQRIIDFFKNLFKF